MDLCAIGAQKAMGGPAGVSAVSVSERAWTRMAANPHAPRRSYLSLLDWKERWIDGGRKALLHAPAQLEMPALEACVERIETEGLDAVMARHASAAAATRAGAVALGGGLESDPTLPLAAGSGVLAKEMIRVNHYGADATPEAVRNSLTALGKALAEKGLNVNLDGVAGV